VGYAAMGFVRGEKPRETNAGAPDVPAWVQPASDRAQLNSEEQATLLRLAKDSIAARLEGSAGGLDLKNYEITPRLMSGQGVFVTLKIGEDLRGCIGRLLGTEPLYRTVAQMACEAAFGDPRFPALSQKELSGIRIEISALLSPDGKVEKMPFKRISGVDQIRVGQDGLMIRSGGRAGLLLPQVPTEQGWGREEFLRHLCLKAGLSPESWKEAEISRFCAQVFSEK
jgi:AmmeMemoRadiSam system protein A